MAYYSLISHLRLKWKLLQLKIVFNNRVFNESPFSCGMISVLGVMGLCDFFKLFLIWSQKEHY